MFAHRYELRAQLGAGAQGEVYKAFDLHEQEIVALKLLGPSHNPWASGLKRQFCDVYPIITFSRSTTPISTWVAPFWRPLSHRTAASTAEYLRLDLLV